MKKDRSHTYSGLDAMRDARQVVPSIAAIWGPEYREAVVLGMEKLQELHKKEMWWKLRERFSNLDWMVEAATVMDMSHGYEFWVHRYGLDCDHVVRFFVLKRKEWFNELSKLTHFLDVIRKWRRGRLEVDFRVTDAGVNKKYRRKKKHRCDEEHDTGLVPSAADAA